MATEPRDWNAEDSDENGSHPETAANGAESTADEPSHAAKLEGVTKSRAATDDRPELTARPHASVHGPHSAAFASRAQAEPPKQSVGRLRQSDDETTYDDRSQHLPRRADKMGRRPALGPEIHEPAEDEAEAAVPQHQTGRAASGSPAVRRPDRWYQHGPLMISLLSVLAVGLVGVAAWAVSLSRQKDGAVRDKGQIEQKLLAAEKQAGAAEGKAKMADNRARAAQDALRDLGTHGNPGPWNPPRAPEPMVEKQRGSYVADIRLAQQAWERGDVALVRRLLEPYRSVLARAGTANGPAGAATTTRPANAWGANDRARDWGTAGPAKTATTGGLMQQDPRDFAWHYLWRLAHTAGIATLQQHTQAVRHAAFTDDGARAVTLGDDGMLIVWDALTGRSVQSLPLTQTTFWQNLYVPADQVQVRQAGGLAIGPEGQWAAACGTTVWAGNFSQQVQPQRFGDHTTAVLSLAMARNGKLLASGDQQGEIILRELPGGKILRRWKNGKPLALSFTHDSKFLLAGMRHGTVYVWDAASGIVKETESFGQAITSLAVARDGQTVAVALADRQGVVCLWEPAARRVRAELRGHHDQVTRVAFSPDGRLILTASRDHTARVWTTAGGLLRTYKGHLAGVEAAGFSPDGQWIITGGSDKTAILWKAGSDPQCEVLTDTPASGWVGSLAFSAGNDRLVAAGRCETSEAFLGLWNLADANRPVPLQSAVSAGTALGFSPDGRQMVVGEASSLDAAAASRLRIWSLETGRAASRLPGLKGTIASAVYSPDGRLLAAALGDPDERVPGLVRVWEPAASTQRYTLPQLSGRVEAAFSPDSKLLMTVTESKRRPGEIRLWNATSGEAQGQIGSPQELQGLTAMALSPDGRSLLTGHGDLNNPMNASVSSLKVWDLTKRQLGAQLPGAHTAAITKVVFSRRGKLAASGDAAGNTRIWDFTTGKPLPTQIPSQNRPITALAFDYLGDRLATGADEKCVRVWHVDTGRQLARLELASSAPTAIRFTPEGNSLVATTNTGGLVVWDAQSYAVRGLLRAEGNPAGNEGHSGEVACAVVTSSGNRVISGGADKTLRVWDTATRKLLSTPFTFNQPVACMALAPGRKTLAVGTGRIEPSLEPGELILCQQGSGQTQAVPRVLFQGIAVSGLAFAPDGDTLAVCAATPDANQGLRRSVALVNMTTLKAVTMPTADTQSVAIAPDGRLLAIGRATGEIELWPIESPPMVEPRRLSQDPRSGEVTTSAYWPGDGIAPRAHTARLEDTPGTRATVTPGSGWQQPHAAGPAASRGSELRNPGPGAAGWQTVPDPNASIPNTVVAAQPMVLIGHRGAVKSLAFSPDGKTLASGADDNDVKLWSVATGEDLLTFKHNGAVEAVRFSSDGRVLATADREPAHGGVRLWRAAPDDR